MTRTVLIIEDNPGIGELVRMQVSDLGMKPVLVDRGDTGLERFREGGVDLVILDLMLPGMDGIDCLIQLKQNSPSGDSPRVVMVTALNDADRRKRALANGAEDYVLKPDLFDRLPELLLQRNRS